MDHRVNYIIGINNCPFLHRNYRVNCQIQLVRQSDLVSQLDLVLSPFFLSPKNVPESLTRDQRQQPLLSQCLYIEKERQVFLVTQTGNKSLEIQVWEAQQIANTNPAHIINGRAEYIRPVIQRMVHADLLDDNRGRGPGVI